MQVAHLQELAELEDSYWWHVAKRELAVKLLAKYAPAPGRLIEGGIGACRNLLAFQELGYQVTGFDVMSEAVELGRTKGLSDVHEHDLGQAWPDCNGDVRAVVLLDVLEHVPDPVLVLNHAKNVLEPEGAIIATVPAYQFLFSDWDRALGHYRRYTAPLLRRQTQEAGLRVRLLTHWNSFTLPAAAVMRTVEKVTPRGRSAEFPRVAPFTNRFLKGCAAAERWMVNRCGVPFGLSVVGVFTR